MSRRNEEGQPAAATEELANAEFSIPTTEQKIDGVQRSNSTIAEQARDIESFRPAKVELWSGVVTGMRIIDADGERSVPCLGGEMFFIDIVEVDGGRCGMWSGRALGQAKTEARLLANDCGVELIDLVHGGQA